MSFPSDLEGLRSIFTDKRTHLAVALVEATELAPDSSTLRAQVKILTQDRSVIVRVCWDACGPNAGSFQFPVKDDLVLIAFAEGDNEQGYLIRRLSSKIDKIPTQAADGSTVFRALAGKAAHLLSDTAILLGRGEATPTEPLVLGLVLKDLLGEILGLIADLADATGSHMHLGNLGAPTGPPTDPSPFSGVSSNAGTLADDPVGNDGILSDFAFTEK